MITIMCGGRALCSTSTSRSNIITPEKLSLSLIVIVQATLVVLTEEEEFSGVMILLRRGRSAAKCSSATHYSYFYPLRKLPRFILCHHTYSCNYSCKRL